MKIKTEEFLVDIYFPINKKFKFFDKEQGYFKELMIVDSTNQDRLKIQLDHKNFVTVANQILKYMTTKNFAHFKGRPASESDALPLNAYLPLQCVVDYKGLTSHICITTFAKGSQQVLGYNGEAEQYVNIVHPFPKTYEFACEELPLLFHCEQKVYSF